jgi:hypothetical protein
LGRVSPQDACEVCGRTFLVGEKVHSYVSVEGRHEVCELCVDRVAAAGWLPAEQDGAEERLRAETERKPGFLGRLFSRSEEDAEPEEDVIRDEGVTDEDERPRAPRRREIHELETERYDVEAEWRGDEIEELAEEEDASPLPRLRRRERLDEEESADAVAPVRRRLSSLFGPRRREADSSYVRASDQPSPDPAAGDAAEVSPNPPAASSPDVPHGHAADLPSPDAVPEPGSSVPPPAAPAPDADASPAPLPDPAGRGMRPRRLQPDLSPASRFERAVSRFNGSDAGRTAAGLTRTLGAPSVSVGDLAGSEDIVRITVAWELTWYQWGVDLGDELRPVFELEKGYEVSEIDAAARQWNASAHEGRLVLVAPGRREAENGRPVHR